MKDTMEHKLKLETEWQKLWDQEGLDKEGVQRLADIGFELLEIERLEN